MTPHFDDYVAKIRSLPADPTNHDVVTPDFLLKKEGQIEVYYAPPSDSAAPCLLWCDSKAEASHGMPLIPSSRVVACAISHGGRKRLSL